MTLASVKTTIIDARSGDGIRMALVLSSKRWDLAASNALMCISVGMNLRPHLANWRNGAKSSLRRGAIGMK